MRVGSLFSGIGGIELGLERAGGFETIWFVENEPHAQAVLKKQFPHATIYDDVTTIDFKTVPKIDILTGGFPCQDISNAGKRVGITGNRSGLWRYCVEAIRTLQPRIAFFENVSALTDRGLNVVLADLASLGYDAEWHCIPASSIGANHRRDRIVILAHSDSSRRLHGQAPEQSDSRGEQTQFNIGEGSQDVADTSIEGLEGWQEAIRQKEGRNSNSGHDRTSIGGDRRDGWWAIEPDVGRVANGIPLRVDRIKRLGNAVVPQWAQAIGEAIKEAEGDDK